MEVAPASYTSAKSAVVIRVREAAFRARLKEEARLAKSTACRDGWPERPCLSAQPSTASGDNMPWRDAGQGGTACRTPL